MKLLSRLTGCALCVFVLMPVGLRAKPGLPESAVWALLSAYLKESRKSAANDEEQVCGVSQAPSREEHDEREEEAAGEGNPGMPFSGTASGIWEWFFGQGAENETPGTPESQRTGCDTDEFITREEWAMNLASLPEKEPEAGPQTEQDSSVPEEQKPLSAWEYVIGV